MIWRKTVVLLLLTIFVSGCSYGLMGGSQSEIIYVNENKEERILQKHEEIHSRPYTIAVIPKLISNSYFDAAEVGAMEAAEDLNVEVIYTGSKTRDPEEQIKMIRKMIHRGVDAIAVSANEPVTLLPILEEARSHNIKVITWDSDTIPLAREFFVNPIDQQSFGRHLMDTMASSLNEQGEFAVIADSLTAFNVSEWVTWIRLQHYEYYPEMNLVEIVDTVQTQESAFAAAERLLSKYPNLSGIIGTSDIITPSAARAVQEADKAGRVKVIGVSTPNSIRSYIHGNSAQMVTLWSPKKLGYLTVSLAKRLLDGKAPYNGDEIVNVGRIRVKDDVVIMGEPIHFTKDNIDQYDF